MNMANEYVERGLRVIDVVKILHIPRCGFYRNDSSEEPLTRRGKNSSYTLRNDGDEPTIVDNRIIVNEIEALLSRVLVCY